MTGPSRRDGPRDRTPGTRPRDPRWAEPFPPIKDLGPVAGVPRGGARRFLDPDMAKVFEAIERAAVAAEAAVEPFVRTTDLPMVRGRAAVGLRFLDLSVQTVFRRCGALTGRTAFESRLMTRRWADAGGDVHLDEHMAYVVANHLQAEFDGRLHATVFVWHERTAPP